MMLRTDKMAETIESLQYRVEDLSNALAASERNRRDLADRLNMAEWRYHATTTTRAWRMAVLLADCKQAFLPRGTWRFALVRKLYRLFTNLLPRQRTSMNQRDPEWNQWLKRLDGSKRPIIFLPSVPWSMTLFQRPQHLARAFARLGHPTFYNCNGTSEPLEGVHEIEPNLYLFKGSVARLRELRESILWTFTYNFTQKLDYAADAETVYDWIDDLSVFPYDQTMLKRAHVRALREATMVTCVARCLHDTATRTRPDALYLPNAVEFDRFADDDVAVPDDLTIQDWLDRPGPVIGYYGALASWFDYNLLHAVAQRRPDWRFLLIGPDYDRSIHGQSIMSQPNVRWLGPRPYPSLPQYLKMMDVTMIPFVINDITLATSPLKLYEYLAAGKPVITTPMPECQAHPQVRIARTADEFIAHLDPALHDSRSAEFRAQVRQVGADNSWDARARTALEQIIPKANR